MESIIGFIIQFIVAGFATFSFAVLFSAPKKELLYCGFSGAFGWILYYILVQLGMGVVVPSLIATFCLTILARIQSQLKDVNKLLKLDPGNTELLAQKHKLLAEAVGETKEKLTTLKTAAEQANTALANGEISQEQYDALQREIVETEIQLTV